MGEGENRSKHNRRSSLFYIHPRYTFTKEEEYTRTMRTEPSTMIVFTKCGLERSFVTKRERVDTEWVGGKEKGWQGKEDKDLNLKIVSVCTVANSPFYPFVSSVPTSILFTFFFLLALSIYWHVFLADKSISPPREKEGKGGHAWEREREKVNRRPLSSSIIHDLSLLIPWPMSIFR